MSFLLTKKALFTSTASASAAGAFYYAYSSSTTPTAKKMLPAYEATFSVPLRCDDCVKDVSSALEKLPGIHSKSCSIPTSMLTTTGTTPPSAIISTIQATGRPAILRGSGRSSSAAVCVLELPPSSPIPSDTSMPTPNPVRGLIRLIELSTPSPSEMDGTDRGKSEPVTLLDMTLTGLRPGTYTASLRASGDISEGARSMGKVFSGLEGTRNGDLGSIVVDEKGRGELVGEISWPIWEAVGRGIVVQREGEGGSRMEDDGGVGAENVVVGVVARSAGIWENEKTVCGCSGKTVWEEREEMVGKGML